MDTTEDIQLKNTEIDFFKIARTEPNPRMRIRFLALSQLKAGKSKQEVCDMFQIVSITLRRWIVRFVTGGLAGKGRKRKLTLEQEEEFRQQVEELQNHREGGRARYSSFTQRKVFRGSCFTQCLSPP